MSKVEVDFNRVKRIAIIRDSVDKIVTLLSGKDIKVIQAGTGAMVRYSHSGEPTHLYLPVIGDDAPDLMLDAIQGFLDHEVAHLLFTKFSVVKEATDKRVGALHNILEDCFIEKEMMKRFKGSRKNLENMRQIFTDKYIEPKMDNYRLIPNISQKEYWNLLLVCAFRAWAGQQHFIDYMSDKWHCIEDYVEKIGDLKDEVPKMQSSEDALELALKVKKALMSDSSGNSSEDEEESEQRGKSGSPRNQQSESEDDQDESGGYDDSEGQSEGEKEDQSDEDSGGNSDGDSEDTDDADSDSDGGSDDSEEDESEEEGSGDSEEDLEDQSEDEMSGGDSGEDGDDNGDDEKEPFADNDQEISDSTREVDPLTEEEIEQFESLDDALADVVREMSEMNLNDQEYLPFSKDWDRVETFEPDTRKPEDLKKLEKQVSENIRGITRQMERIFVAKNKSRWERGHKSGRINGTSLARLAANDDRVFKRLQEMKTKKVAVSLLVDNSGSMGGPPIKLASQIAWAMSEVLSKIDIPNEIIGFTDMWDQGNMTQKQKDIVSEMNKTDSNTLHKFTRLAPLHMPIYKSFSERFSLKVKQRLTNSAMSNVYMGANVDGESVLVAAERLNRREEPGKILIVLSDGFPAVAHCSPPLAYEHLKQSVKAVEKNGVQCIGIGMMSRSVENFYPKHVVCNNLDELPTVVMKELQKVILQR